MQHEWGRSGYHIGYWWESKTKIDKQEGQYVAGWIILRMILERERLDWIDLAQDKEQ
jgi:hypothetical protein